MKSLRSRIAMATLALSTLAAACNWFAETPAPIPATLPTEAAETSLALTVYNQGSALVRDRRRFTFQEGFNEIAFSHVAASIDPTSVLFKSLSDGEGLAVLEQNYEWLITKPTLVWHLLADRGGPQDVEITYLTGGLSWQSDYVVLLASDEKSLDLDGWVTLSNTSGTSYQDAQLKLIAGDLQRLPEPGFAGDVMTFEEMERAAAAPVEQREFFEYHLYEVPRPVSVKDNETKQIEFVSVDGVPSEKFFVYDGLQCRNNYWYCNVYGYPQTDPSYGVASNPKVMVMLEFDTDEVDADLPRGRVRVYQEDVDGAALLIGEDSIDHTPKGESLRLYIGDAFDIVGERVQTDFRRPSDKRLEEEFEITLRNHKDESVEVRVVEHLFRWSEWKILHASEDYTKLDSSTIEFRVRIPANGETTLTYGVRYFWP